MNCETRPRFSKRAPARQLIGPGYGRSESAPTVDQPPHEINRVTQHLSRRFNYEQINGRLFGINH